MNELEITRRQMLKVLGGGILVLATVPDSWAAAWAQRGRQQIPQTIAAWVHIGTDGRMTVLTGKAEVGQNARTSITQAAAEELRVAPGRVSITMADTDLVPYDMGTFGSRTTPTMLPQVRRAAAAAREALIDLAAEAWKVDRSNLTAADGLVSGAGHSASYGEIAKGQPLDKPIPSEVRLTPAAEWKVLGTSLAKVDAATFVTGGHRYASDMSRPGMLYAKVLRPPSFGATLTSADTSKAQAMAGVEVVHDDGFVGVAAPTLRAAEAALQSIQADWKEVEQPSAKDLRTILMADGPPRTQAKGERTFHGTYTAAFIAHVPLEPRAALAEWDGTKMTVHTGTQRPFAVRDEVVAACGLTQRQVRVIVPDTGSGYGGKHTGEAAVEAARIAKAVGKPVKLVWTRPEEMTFAYFRPAGVVEISSAVDRDGRLTAWTHDNYNSGGSAIDTPYEVAERRTDYHEADSPLRKGSYRSLAACFNNFARESHMDELAHMLSQDPLKFRLANLANPRLKAVLLAAADKFGWASRAAVDGHGFGIACGTEKGSCVSVAAEVLVSGKDVQVLRAVIAFECGAIVNPDHLRNQVEGALIMGLGGALFEEILFDKGRILNARLSAYRVPRYKDVPAIESVLIDRKDLPSAGAGETPIIGIAPAVGNAIFAATGTRLRSLPMKL